MRSSLAIAWVAILVAMPACAGGPQPGTVTGFDRNTITPEELGQRSFYSAYDAVETLRPGWLNKRGQDGDIQVYVDDNHVGGLEVLRRIRLPSVYLMRHMDGIQAAARYGDGHELGVILVSTRAAGH